MLTVFNNYALTALRAAGRAGLRPGAKTLDCGVRVDCACGLARPAPPARTPAQPLGEIPLAFALAGVSPDRLVFRLAEVSWQAGDPDVSGLPGYTLSYNSGESGPV